MCSLNAQKQSGPPQQFFLVPQIWMGGNDGLWITAEQNYDNMLHVRSHSYCMVSHAHTLE